MSRTPVTFRVDDGDLSAVEEIAADSDGASRSDVLAEAVRQYLDSDDVDLDDDTRAVLQRQRIADSARTGQHRAYLRTNVVDKLRDAFRGVVPLTADEAEAAVAGYRREADEVHGDAALVEFVDGAVEAYRDCLKDGDITPLERFCKAWVAEHVEGVEQAEDADIDLSDDADASAIPSAGTREEPCPECGAEVEVRQAVDVCAEGCGYVDPDGGRSRGGGDGGR